MATNNSSEDVVTESNPATAGTSRYRVIAPHGIHLGLDFYGVNSIINLTAGGAKYLLLNSQIALASEQAPVGVPDGPSEDDVKIDIYVNSAAKTVSLTKLREMFPSIQGPEGQPGLQGPRGARGEKGDKGSDGHSIYLKGVVWSANLLPEGASQGDVYLVQTTSHWWAWLDSSWVDIGSFRGEQGLQGLRGPEGERGEKGERGPLGAVDPADMLTIANNVASAAAYADAAHTSATNAASSKSAAAGSASAAATSETNASNSAAASAGSASAAAMSASAAGSSEVNAGVSASHAATSESNAAASATAAAASKSATDAALAAVTTLAADASTSASNAHTSETNAAASESAAATSASAAATSETNAAASATAAAGSASDASTSASSALGSKNAASTSASNAATSESNAAASAAAAAASAGAMTPASALPLVDGAASVGSSSKYAREDHRHGTDTTRAPVASPSFTGNVSVEAGSYLNFGATPGTSGYGIRDNAGVIETKSSGAAWSPVATTAYVSSTVANLVGSAPSALDTLNELASALGNDANFSTTVSAALGNRLRVDTNAQGLDATQQSNGRTNLGLGNAATLNVGTTAGTVAAGNDSRFTAGAFTTLTVGGNAVWHAGNFSPSSYLPLGGGTMTGLLTGATLNVAMSQDGGAAKGSFVCRASGTGDGNLAGMSFWNDSYAIKLGVRADGYFGLGGWSRGAWSWYSAPSGDMVAAGNISAYSDPDLKDDVSVISDALDIIRQLEGVRFTWNHKTKLIGRPGERDIGVLADQVQAALPELVSLSIPDEDNDGKRWRTVAYDKLVPVLIEGIKAQQAQIDALLSWARSNGFDG
ncbi:tail fiber domain-containing protein [Bradyrhizobium denitrificans]